MPIVDSKRLPKDTAGRGLTSTLRPRNLVKEKTQREERKYYSNLTGQAGQATGEILISRTGLGRRRVTL